MYRPLLGLAALVSILTLPLAAHADTIDDFLLTGGGHTISYSYPATATFPDVEFFSTSAFATIDGVPGYPLAAVYNSNSNSPFPTLQLFVPEATFGYPMLNFQGPGLVSTVLVPDDTYDPFNPFAIEATFNPGTYQLIGVGVSFDQPEGPPVPYTLSITPETPTAATPEPSTLALLATGVFGLLGFATIRHNRTKLTH